MIDKIIQLTNKYEHETIHLRRILHQNPDLSNKEFKTSKLVEEELFKIGLEVKGLGETGIVSAINGTGNLKEDKLLY